MKNLLFVFFACVGTIYSHSQTATNFNTADCNAVNHDLFSELDAGKVIVITWVMPCGTCIAPAATVSTVVANYGNPNVLFYLCDDYANTTCATLISWAGTNGISADAFFSAADIDMTDYGTAGMPKTVVIGGPAHTIFFNDNGSIQQTALEDSIDSAVSATVGILEKNNPDLKISVFPNPVSHQLNLKYTLEKSCEVSIDVVNILGEIISTRSLGSQSEGSQEYNLFVENLDAGFYFINLQAGENTATIKFNVVR